MQRQPRLTPEPSAGDDIRSLAVVGAAVALLAPLSLVVSASLRPLGMAPPQSPVLVQPEWSMEAYRSAFAWGGLGRALLNSLLVCALAVPLSVLVAALAGFAMSQLPRRAATLLGAASLLALMVPASALLVPRLVLYRGLHLTDTLVPLIAPALIATSPLYPLVYFLAFRALPGDLYDSCRLAGLSPLRTWWYVGMPLVRPVTAAVAAFAFVTTWSNVLDPLVYLYRRELFTLPLALRSLATVDPADAPVLLAAAVVATVPAVLVFALAQRLMRRRHGSGRV